MTTKSPPQTTHQTPQAKDPPTSPHKELSYLTMLLLPVPGNMQIIPPTEDISNTPCLVKTLEHGRNKEVIDFNLLDHMFPSRKVNNENPKNHNM